MGQEEMHPVFDDPRFDELDAEQQRHLVEKVFEDEVVKDPRWGKLDDDKRYALRKKWFKGEGFGSFYDNPQDAVTADYIAPEEGYTPSLFSSPNDNPRAQQDQQIRDQHRADVAATPPPEPEKPQLTLGDQYGDFAVPGGYDPRYNIPEVVGETDAFKPDTPQSRLDAWKTQRLEQIKQEAVADGREWTPNDEMMAKDNLGIKYTTEEEQMEKDTVKGLQEFYQPRINMAVRTMRKESKAWSKMPVEQRVESAMKFFNENIRDEEFDALDDTQRKTILQSYYNQAVQPMDKEGQYQHNFMNGLLNFADNALYTLTDNQDYRELSTAREYLQGVDKTAMGQVGWIGGNVAPYMASAIGTAGIPSLTASLITDTALSTGLSVLENARKDDNFENIATNLGIDVAANGLTWKLFRTFAKANLQKGDYDKAAEQIFGKPLAGLNEDELVALDKIEDVAKSVMIKFDKNADPELVKEADEVLGSVDAIVKAVAGPEDAQKVDGLVKAVGRTAEKEKPSMRKGMVTREAVQTIAGAGVGATVGAAVDDENRGRGAAMGAVVGGTGANPRALKYMGKKALDKFEGSPMDATQRLFAHADETAPGAVGDIVDKKHKKWIDDFNAEVDPKALEKKLEGAFQNTDQYTRKAFADFKAGKKTAVDLDEALWRYEERLKKGIRKLYKTDGDWRKVAELQNKLDGIGGLRQVFSQEKKGTVGDVLKHEKLYKAEPWVKDTPVIIKPDTDMDGYKAYFNGSEIHVAQSVADDPAAFKSTMLHEIQHNIQDRYKWSPGGNTRDLHYDDLVDTLKMETKKPYFDKLKKQLDAGEIDAKTYYETVINRGMEDAGMKLSEVRKRTYKRLGGEQESRAAEAALKHPGKSPYQALVKEEGKLDKAIPNSRNVRRGAEDEEHFGKKYDEFFTAVVNGEPKYMPSKDYEYLHDFGRTGKAVKAVMDRSMGSFDKHIASSIPTFRESQVNKAQAIVKTYPEGAKVLDLGGSEGGFVKSVTKVSKGKIKTVNLDAAPDMIKAHNDHYPVPGSKAVLGAFQHGWEGVPTFRPKKEYDVVHESMLFQFINKERTSKIAEVKKFLKDDGLFITEEKFQFPDANYMKQNEKLKDTLHKNNYFTAKQLAEKTDEVLMGMHKNQALFDEYVKELGENFKYVKTYWKSGNFRGVVASNNKAKIDKFMENLEPINTSKFNADPGPLPKYTHADVNTKATPKDYAAAIKAAKERLGDKGALVDEATERSAAKIVKDGGKLYLTKDGMAGAYVKADGYMGGLFRNPDSQKTAAAAILQDMRKNEGGKFFDSFAQNEKLYKDNGWKPVARMKFNEEFAPENWEKNKFLRTKPDNVFFTKNGLSDKWEAPYFTDYDEAYAYAKRLADTEIDPKTGLVIPKTLTTKDVEDLDLVPTLADLTGTHVVKGHQLKGGPGFPLIPEMYGRKFVWAARDDSQFTAWKNQAKELGHPDYIDVVVMNMKEDAHASNAHVASLMFHEALAKPIPRDVSKALMGDLRKIDPTIPSIRNKEKFIEHLENETFDNRKEIVVQFKKHLPRLETVLIESADPAALATGFKKGDLIFRVDLKAGETVEPGIHPAYDRLFKGEVLGKLGKPINAEQLWIKDAIAKGSKPKDAYRSYSLSKHPVKLKDYGVNVDPLEAIKSPKHAQVFDDAANNRWTTMKPGSAAGRNEFVKDVLVIQKRNVDPKKIYQEVKKGERKVIRLGDHQAVVSIKGKTIDYLAVNRGANPGAEEILIRKAIDEGAKIAKPFDAEQFRLLRKHGFDGDMKTMKLVKNPGTLKDWIEISNAKVIGELLNLDATSKLQLGMRRGFATAQILQAIIGGGVGATTLANMDPNKRRGALVGGLLGAIAGLGGGMAYNKVFRKMRVAGGVLPPETIAGRVQRAIQNKMNRVVELVSVKAGDNIPDWMNPVQAEVLMHGRAQDRMDRFRNYIVQPFVRKVAQSSYDLDEVDLYLHARHAKERNEAMWARGSELDNPSGMTDDEADAIMARYDTPEMKKLARYVDNMNEARLRIIEEEGLESDETIEMLRNSYKHYVPLMRDMKEPFPMFKGSSNKGLSNRMKEFKRAKGSSRKVLSPTAMSIVNFQATLTRAEKNRVARAMYNFIQEFPDNELYEVKGVKHAPQFDENGEVVRMNPQYQMAPNVMHVKIDGKVKEITLKDEALAAAFKNLNATEMNAVMKVTHKAVRFMAGLSTTYNPEFVISNLFRDFQEAMANLQVGGKAGLTEAKFAKEVATALATVKKGGSEYNKLYKEFSAMGAKTGWMDSMDLDKAARDINIDVEIERGSRPVRKYWRKTLELIDIANEVVENSTRLAAYKMARDNGLSKAKAAVIAKELTVNFNKKGELGTAMNTLWMFSNAAMQGTARLFKALKSSRKAKAAAVTLMGAGVAVDQYNRLYDEDRWDSVPKYLKDHNIIILTEKGQWQIPLPYGYSFFKSMGDIAGEAYAKGELNSEMVGQIMTAAIDAYNPIGGDQGFRGFVPTVAQGAYDVATNSTFFGGQYMPDKPPFRADDKPDSQKRFNTVAEPFVWMAETVNEMTGGTAKEKGAVDVSPETLEYWTQFVTGGLGKFVMNTGKTISRSTADDKEIAWSDVPFARKLYRDDKPKELGYAARKIYDKSGNTKLSERDLERWDRLTTKAVHDGSMTEEEVKKKDKELRLNQVEVDYYRKNKIYGEPQLKDMIGAEVAKVKYKFEHADLYNRGGKEYSARAMKGMITKAKKKAREKFEKRERKRAQAQK